MELIRYRDVTQSQNKDTGMAMVLILLMVGFFSQDKFFYVSAIPVLILNMTWPSFFRPLAVIWYGISYLLGAIMSSILLSIVFILIVTPIGMIRRILGKDSLQLKKWKKGRVSVFKIRQTQVDINSLKKPF